jgi:tetratricopeptide (TPR) repeat protein
LGQYELAEAQLSGALETIRESVGDRDDEFRMLTDLARLRLATGRYAEALALTMEAAAIADELHNVDGLGAVLLEQARARAASGAEEEALREAKHGLKLLEETGSGERWRGYQILASLLEQRPDAQSKREALEALRRSVGLLGELREQLANEHERCEGFVCARQAVLQQFGAALRQNGFDDEAAAFAREWKLAVPDKAQGA